MTAEKKYEELKRLLMEVDDLSMAGSVLSWDQATYLPPKGAAARGRQMATLGRLQHQKFTSPVIGQLLDALEPWAETLPYDSDEASLVRVTRRGYDRMVKIPTERFGAFTQHTSDSYSAWADARPKNDFAAMKPYLEKTLDFSREFANYFPGHDHIADPLIDFADYGMKAQSVRTVFSDLRDQLVPMVEAITQHEPADNQFLLKNFPTDQQQKFGEKIIRDFGFDFERGRQDLTLHPFMTKFSLNDVRITTRFHEHDLGDGLFSTMHESGHGMYELGINQSYEATPLANGTSAGVHESQSRLWENLVGRSRGFWERYYPDLKELFPEQLKGVSLEKFYRGINRVERSLIRVDADEVTYNLHVMLRFELELQMLEGALSIDDLPEVWNARIKADLGVEPQDDKDGVMQDVHWYAGLIGGAFQGYTLGNIMSSLFYYKAVETHPNIPDQIKKGAFGALHGWLKENIYQHGAKFTANELIERTTGGGLTIEPYIKYLKTKYGELYEIA